MDGFILGPDATNAKFASYDTLQIVSEIVIEASDFMRPITWNALAAES